MIQAFSSIHDVIANYLVELLTDALVTNSPDPMFTPNTVRYGNLQANPARERISVLVHLRDPDQQSDLEPPWSDQPAFQTPEWNMYPDGEIGGSGTGFWARRLVIEIIVYTNRTKEDRDDARMVGAYVTRLAQRAIETSGCCSGGTHVDDFGESILQLRIDRIPIVEGGGPPGNFNYRSKLYVSALTETT